MKPTYHLCFSFWIYGMIFSFSAVPLTLHAEQGRLQIPLQVPAIEISIDQDGSAIFSASGIQWLSLTGEPEIPWLVLDVILPPDAMPNTASVHLENKRYANLAGPWVVRPTPPAMTWQDGEPITIWPEDKNIDQGRDIDIYTKDASWPSMDIQLVHTGQLRHWKLARMAVPLIKYNPVQGAIQQLTFGNAVMTFEQGAQAISPTLQLTQGVDPIGDKMVRRIAVNYYEQREAYRTIAAAVPAAAPIPIDGASSVGFTIITTSIIQSNSTKLADFVTHKQSLGFDVQVITEVDFGGGTGDMAAENIRDWLINHYLTDRIQYVLILGDPRPLTSQVPMKIIMTDTPTDLYFADLTGNWDLDGDGIYGEAGGDSGEGGIDTYWEVYVGRIPYYGSISTLDSILQRTIEYDMETLTAPAWRRNVLLPMEPLSEPFPSYPLGEQIKNDFAIPAGWGYHRVYDADYGLVPPAETIPCTKDNVTNAWNNGAFGLVSWCTHGTAKAAAGVMDLSHASTLNDVYRTFTFQGSCSNAYPETTNNLAYILLTRGGICTIGATRTAYYSSGEKDFAGSASCPGMVYEYSHRIIRLGATSGEALHDMKQALTANSLSWWTNILVYILYGDPSLRVIQSPIRFVDDDAAPGGNGLSWATAYDDLQSALDEAAAANSNITEIWVADGTYRPSQQTDSGDPRSATFQLVNNMRIFGGFAGNEKPGIFDLDDRSFSINQTILSGDLNSDDNTGGNNSENTYHVITASDTDTTTVLDGFVITAGNADGLGPHALGGGIYSVNGHYTLSKCTIIGNFASDGAGIYNMISNPTLYSCVLKQNQALNNGGGIYNLNQSGPELINCTLVDNHAAVGGGIANCTSSTPVLINSILWSNSDSGGWDESAQINGGSPTVSYSCIQGLSTFMGNNNISDDPLFDTDGIHLFETSPCVNTGDPDLDYSRQSDLDGENRIQHCRVDIGADETDYYRDCNNNSRADACDLSYGSSGDCNNNAIPDECEPDFDNDDIIDDCDNCPQTPNTNQADNDNDGVGDACDDDDDNDGVLDTGDNCPFTDNPDQVNSDGDPLGDACDHCPNTIADSPVDEFGCPPDIPTDFDNDGDVDLVDFSFIQLCLSGNGIPHTPECADANLDDDDDVDQNDVAIFLDCMSGTNIPAPPECIHYVDTEPPQLISAYSRKWHGNLGEFDIPLPLGTYDSTNGGKFIDHGMECRIGGPTKIVLVFSEPIQVEAGISGSDGGIRIYPGTLNETIIDENLMFLNIADVTDGSCMTISISGVTDLVGNPLTGDNNVNVRVLLGDINADNLVNISDLSEVKAYFSSPLVHENNCRIDVNGDGIINELDLETVRTNLFKSANGCIWNY